MFYRIEKNGVGPYRYKDIYPNEGLSLDLWMDKQHLKHQMPTPLEDSVLARIYNFIEQTSKKFPKDVLFAFNNKDLIFTHFSEDEILKLEKLGFRIVSYNEADCTQVLNGETQSVLFLSEDSYKYYINTIEESAKSGFIPF